MEDHTLLGDGRYPETGPLAVLARLGFVASALAIVMAVILPPETSPHFARSRYLEHFAAFYVAALFGLAAWPRRRLRIIAAGYVAFAALIEPTHLLGGAPAGPVWQNWVADVGGLAAAVAPVVFERFRRRFPKSTASEASP
jgi:peptidoglycan/LPS O-acetylase OafA/YrhL